MERSPLKLVSKLNVNGDVVLGGFIPDFVNVNGRKLLVEMFGTYWHGPEVKNGRTPKQEEAFRKKHFKKFGFNTVIIWENELDDVDKVVARVRKGI